MLWWSAMKSWSTAMTKRSRSRVPSGSMLALPDLRRSDRENPTTNFWLSLFLTALAWYTCTGLPLDRQSTRITMFSGNSGRYSVGRDQHSSNRVNGISTGTMHQYTTSSLSQTIWQRWASRLFLTSPIVRTLLPVTFGYSLSSRKKLRGCRYEITEEMKDAVTKVIDTLTQEDLHGGVPEVVGTVQQVHCSRRRLLRRGLEFHVYTINKSDHTKKVWKLI